MYAGIFPTWAVVTINVVFYCGLLCMGVVFIVSSIRKEEKALWVAVYAIGVLTAVRILFPRISGIVQPVTTVLSLTAFFAALAILLSFYDENARK
jgi:hypothetical protein